MTTRKKLSRGLSIAIAIVLTVAMAIPTFAATFDSVSTNNISSTAIAPRGISRDFEKWLTSTHVLVREDANIASESKVAITLKDTQGPESVIIQVNAMDSSGNWYYIGSATLHIGETYSPSVPKGQPVRVFARTTNAPGNVTLTITLS